MQFRTTIGIAVALAAGVCSAATYMWTGGAGDGKFSSPANWGGEPTAFTAEDTCVFVNTAALDVTVDEPVTVGTITFSGFGALTVGGEATLMVTRMTNVYSQQPVFNCPVVFSAGYLVDFATEGVNFAGGVTASGPSASLPDTAVTHTLLGEFHFTADWVQDVKLTYPYVVPSGSKLYGRQLSGTTTDGTTDTNPSGLALVIEEGGYAEFDKVISMNNFLRVSVRGRLKLNDVYQVGVNDGRSNVNSHVGFDGDEQSGGVIEAGGIHKYSQGNCYVKVPTLYVGAQGLGAKIQDYTLHLDGCDKTVYATADFEIMGPFRSADPTDWGLVLDKAMTLDTQGFTVTWTGGARGSGALIKTGAGTLVMKPHGCNFTGAVTVSGGTLKIGGQGGVGGSPITVASGATLEFDNPDKTVISNSVTLEDGSTLAFNIAGGLLQGRPSVITPPASGTVAIAVTGDLGVIGTTYPITSGAAISQEDFARFSLQGRNDLEMSLSDAGDIVLTVLDSAAVVDTFAYAAADAAEAVWSYDVASWIKKDSLVKEVFGAGGNAIFTGDIPTAMASVTVPGEVVANDVVIETPSDLTLMGAGTVVGAGTVSKTGAGTLTLNGANFDAQNFVFSAGKVVLGPSAGARSLGTDSGSAGGKVSILDGAQFNVNYMGEGTTEGGNNVARAEITQLKTFVIAGEGPDGRGALVSDSLDGRETHTVWNSALRRVELSGDATVGGVDRLDIRVRTGTAATSTPGIYGPDKNLTVKHTGIFGVVKVPMDVNSVLVTAGGIFRPEEVPEDSVSIPGGITLDNGTLHAYNMTYPAMVDVRTVEGSVGAVNAESSTTTFKGTVQVAANSELDLGGGSTDCYAGGVTNNGAVVVKAGRHVVSGGDLAGNGTWTQTSGYLHFGGGCTMDGPKTVDVSGGDGSFMYGWSGSAYGKLNQKVTVENSTATGAVGFDLGASATITANDIEVNGDVRTLRLRSRNDSSVVGRLEGIELSVVNDGFRVGTDGLPANYVLGAGTHITAANMWIGNSVDSPYSILTLAEGSLLEVVTTCDIGDREGNGTQYDYRLVVDGGTLRQTGTKRLKLGYRSNAAYVDFKSGVMDLYGIQCQNAWVSPTDYVEKFTMDGGTLIIGAGGICAWTHFEPFVQLNNGVVNCSTDWVVEQMRAVSFGDRSGGHVDFDIGDKTIDWRTGLIGAADVTLKGNGTFKSGIGVKNDQGAETIRFQGVTTGNWTIENTGVNDLYGSSGFHGGLHLKEDILANIRIGGSNLVDVVFLQTGADKFAEACALQGACPFACNDLTMLNAKEGAANFSNGNVIWQGQFYADTAGTWTFAGGYDDSVRIDVDGQKVMEHTTWNTVAKGTVDLTVGWHDFRIVQYQAGGGWGAEPAGWKGVMNVGFAKSAVDNTDAANYLKFDAENLPLRNGPVTGGGGTVNWHVVHEKDDWNTRTDWTFEAVTNSISMLDIYNVVLPETIGNSVHMFDGWVFVPVVKSGDWAVYADFDDRASLKIDGVDSGANGDNNDAGHNGSIPGVTPGWHRFEMRVCDTGGNWGPWNGTTGQAKNPAIKITVNGATYNFNEKNFRFSHLKPVEYAGLDGEIRLDAGSTLVNNAAKACPVWGTLAGTGSLVGPYAFAGESNAWAVTGDSADRELERVNIADASAETFRGLKMVKARFDAKPKCSSYYLTEAVAGLMAADVEGIAVEVTDGEKDYSDKFSLSVESGRLVLKNKSPVGTVFFLR